MWISTSYICPFFFSILVLFQTGQPQRIVCSPEKKQLCASEPKGSPASECFSMITVSSMTNEKSSLQRSDFQEVEHHTPHRTLPGDTEKTSLSSGTDTVRLATITVITCVIRVSCPSQSVPGFFSQFWQRKRNCKLFCNITLALLITHIGDHKLF